MIYRSRLGSVLIAVAWALQPDPSAASQVPGEYPTIQAALDHAAAGEQIVVEAGTYIENLVWPDADNLTLRGESGNAEDCVVDGSNANAPVLSASLGSDTRLTIRDLTLRNGHGDPTMYAPGAGFNLVSSGTGRGVLENVQVSNNEGSGVFAEQAVLELHGCLIQGNLLAAVFVEEGDLIADGNTFRDTANPQGVSFAGGGVGVGILSRSATVTFINNTVEDNAWGLGIVLWNYQTTPHVTSDIRGNYFEGNGHPESYLTGGVCLYTVWPTTSTSQSFQIRDNNLNHNRGQPAENSTSGGINVVGGGMVGSIAENYVYGQEGASAFGILVAAWHQSAVVVDRNFVRDTVGLGPFDPEENILNGGVGLRIESDGTSTVTATNNFLQGNCPQGVAINTYWDEMADLQVNFTNNTVVESCERGIEKGEGVTGQVLISNSILWGNGDDLVHAQATYSDIQDGDFGDGNISQSPLFTDPIGGDFHIAPGSPCINRGSNEAPALPDTDYDGDLRPLGGVVDMGADEYSGNTPAGLEVVVDLEEAAAEVKFDNVIQAGQTTVDKHIGYPPEPEGFRLLSEPTYVYDVDSSAGYTGGIRVCIGYQPPPEGLDESLIRLLHEEAGEYVDRTVLPVDTVNHLVCADVASFSQFLPAAVDCPDADEDGYAAETCGWDDCNDANPAVHPGAVEVCTNGIDDDCDSFGDAQDPDCQPQPGWGAAASAAASTSEGAAAEGSSLATNWLALLGLVVGLILLQRLWARRRP